LDLARHQHHADQAHGPSLSRLLKAMIRAAGAGVKARGCHHSYTLGPRMRAQNPNEWHDVGDRSAWASLRRRTVQLLSGILSDP
jgi:hypothetical protein